MMPELHGWTIGGGSGTTLAGLGVAADATELSYVDGVTSAIQTQLNIITAKPFQNYAFTRADAAFTLTNGTSTQPIFSSGQDEYTVTAGMTYRFRMAVRMTTGATSATVQFIFGGTATFTTLNALTFGIGTVSGSGASPLMNNMESNALTTVVGGSATVNKRFTIEGDFEINAGGTIIPSVKFLADPTGTLTTDVGSFFELWPTGANPVTIIGSWS